MSHEVIINPNTGHLSIGKDITLFPNQPEERVRKLLIGFSIKERDMKNGYCWLNLNNLLFGMESCALDICFYQSHLTAIHWGVDLPNEATENDWPTKNAIEEEIIFVRNELHNQLGAIISDKGLEFPWGSVWSVFDPKGFTASNGLRYF